VSKHGRVIGFYIPLEREEDEARRAVAQLGEAVERVLVETGINELGESSVGRGDSGSAVLGAVEEAQARGDHPDDDVPAEKLVGSSTGSRTRRPLGARRGRRGDGGADLGRVNGAP